MHTRGHTKVRGQRIYLLQNTVVWNGEWVHDKDVFSYMKYLANHGFDFCKISEGVIATNYLQELSHGLNNLQILFGSADVNKYLKHFINNCSGLIENRILDFLRN